jgi:hypothetical protein
MSQPETAALIQKAASTATYGGSAGAMYFGYTANEIAAFGGLFVAIIGLVVSQLINWYYKAQHLKLAKKNQSEFYDE